MWLASQGVVKEIDLSRMPALAQKEAKNEVDVLRCLKHPNIVAYCDSFLQGRILCIVMEFADAGDLNQLIKKKKASDEVLREGEVLPIFGQCCLALQHIHKQHILHRDLKTQNIFLTLSGVVKLGDFGIAKVLDHTAAEAITMIGTPIYLAPEVCHSKPYGIKADVWSMGVVLYELLNLAPPFTGSNMAALINNIVTAVPKDLADSFSQDLRELVFDILQKVPHMRPTVKEILERPVVRGVAENLPGWSMYHVASPESEDDVTMIKRPAQEAPEAPPVADSLEDLLRRSGERRRPPLPESPFAGEYRRNRDAAMAAKARVEGPAWRSHSADAGGLGSAGEKAAREAEHLLALQKAAAQARQDRRQVQQRIQAEKEAVEARYEVHEVEAPETRFGRSRASSADNAKHLFELQEAAAQARRDRKMVQQRIKELERGADHCDNSDFDISQDDSPRRPVQKTEADHLLALQQARAEARRDRKMIDAKRRALEAEKSAAEQIMEAGCAFQDTTPRLSAEDKAAAEAKHMQALKDAAAEARRERRMLQQRNGSGSGAGTEDSPRDRPSSGEDCAKRVLAAKAEAQRLEEEQRLQALREASAQARQDRKLLQKKVREIEWGDGYGDPATSQGEVDRDRKPSISQRSPTLGMAGRLSLSRPASEERSGHREEQPPQVAPHAEPRLITPRVR